EYVREGEMIFRYKIEGRQADSCEINVKMLGGDLNNQDMNELKNKEMICSLPFGSVMMPESNLNNCHGMLKESLQDLMIERMHKYIINNLGEINLEIFNPTI
ncbi:MAG: hypothetical protein ACP5D2_04910, partial [Candidatus Nanoarchaeia archaeon]